MTNSYDLLMDPMHKSLYRIIRDSLIRHAELIPLPTDEMKPEEINSVIKAILTDNPELFWFEGKWALKTVSGAVCVTPMYIYDADTSKHIQDQLPKICKSCLDKIDTDLDDYEKISKIYDWILTNVQYDVTQQGGQNICDALVSKKAVCKGLSKAFQYLAVQCGCNVTLRYGSIDGIDRHVWNIVEVNGNLYNIDVSIAYDCFSFLFNGAEKGNKKRGLMIDDEKLRETHKIICSVI